MPTVLTIDAARVIRAAGLDEGAAADQVAAAKVIGDNQPGIEAQISARALGDTTLVELLTLGVTELLAADLLDRRSRVVGASEGLTAGGVAISHISPPGPALRATALDRLAPYLRRATAVIGHQGSGQLSLEAQEDLFGKCE